MPLFPILHVFFPVFKAIFTNLDTKGRYGPTMLGSHYKGQDHDGQVTLSGGIQLWSVPSTGDYSIEAIGAAGGYDIASNSSTFRGRGARMTGIFRLNKAEVIRILVGQEGMSNNVYLSSGGGGGTFVVKGSDTPLIIAGGGGGVYRPELRFEGCDASQNMTGNTGLLSWPGGKNGHGAKTADNGTSGKGVLARSLRDCSLFVTLRAGGRKGGGGKGKSWRILVLTR